MQKITPSHILGISLLIWIVTYNVWQYTDACIYYIGTAQIIMAASWIIHTRTEGVNHFISRVFLFLSFNNLADELFFDPTAIELNEFLMFALFLIYSAWKWKSTKS